MTAVEVEAHNRKQLASLKRLAVRRALSKQQEKLRHRLEMQAVQRAVKEERRLFQRFGATI